MCKFFSFVTNPVDNPGWYYYFDWQYRKANLDDEGVDSHSHICAHFNLDEDRCNKYEFNPLTNKFEIDMINSERNDSEAAEKWAKRLDFKTVIEPLIVKPIVHPFELPEVTEVTAEHIQWLREWASVRASVWNSVGASVRDSVGASVASYVSTFFAIDCEYDFSSAVKLWEAGLVPSFDGRTWRLHTGKNAKIVYEESEE